MTDKKKGNKDKINGKNRTYYSEVLARARCEPHNATAEEFGWFHMENYQFIQKLSVRDLICELTIRADLGIVANTRSDHGMITKELFDEIYADITSGKPNISVRFLSDTSRPEIIKLAEDLHIDLKYERTAVRELNVQDIYDCHEALIAGDGDTFSLAQLHSQHPCCCLSKKLPEDRTKTLLTELQSPDVEFIYLSVDPTYSDLQLIDSFKKTLKNIRDKNNLLTVSEEKEHVLSNHKLHSIERAKIMPLMDLIIWQVMNKKALDLRQIFNLLKGNDLDARAVNTDYHPGNFITCVLEPFEQILNEGKFASLINTFRLKTNDYDKTLRKAIDEF
ncbi:Uncharacterised protein [Yersinia rohdei]|uniref:Uncharacterized protein n=1 Tax=Yersinia rohdei TaxID=29485 RepID=A0A0U1HRA0_YERRO|nr:DUF6387 family protein [Yersinia rohdei]CQI89180.1 Uncharacterised protein [Yersinia rohdei]